MSPSSVTLLEGGELKPVDRLLRWWRFRKARPFIKPTDRVLDVGCSDGALFRYLRGRYREGVGIDPALRTSVDRSRYRLLPGTFPDGLPDRSTYDVITMLAVVEHLPEDRLRSLGGETARALNEGGRVVLTVPSPVVDSLLHFMERIRLIRGMCLHEHHGFHPRRVSEVFNGSDLRLVRARRFQLGLNNLFVFQKVASAGHSR